MRALRGVGALCAVACSPTFEARFADVTVVPDPAMVTRAEVLVTAPSAGPVTLRCTSAAGDDFRQVSPASVSHTLQLEGLAPDTAYDCAATWLGAATPFAFTTGPLPEGLPVTPAVGEPLGGAWLLYPVAVDLPDADRMYLLIVDPDGLPRWYLDLTTAVGLNVSFEAAFLADRSLLLGGAGMASALRYDLAGQLLWSGPEGLGRLSHDVQQLPDGQLLLLEDAPIDDGAAGFAGFAIERLDPADGTVTWSFHAQDAYDRGELDPTLGLDPKDPWHANAIAWVEDDPEGPAVWTSLRASNELVRIDVATGAITWHLGPNGDFTLLDATGAPDLAPDHWFYGQHGPDYERLPDGRWRAWMLDDGWFRPVPTPYSRAIALDVDLTAKTAQVSWDFRDQGWFEPILGDVDRLADGAAALVVEAHCFNCSGEDSRFVDVDAATNAVSWSMDLPGSVSTYRAQRIDSCALFDNDRYCPTDP